MFAGEPTDPQALLRRPHREYPGVPLYVHENGAAFHDVVSAGGELEDSDRRGYIARHIDVVRQAVLDFTTQRRTLESSGRWYAQLFKAHRQTRRT